MLAFVFHSCTIAPIETNKRGNIMQVNTERTVQGWRVSAIIGEYRVSMQYIGYTKAQAIAKFKRTHRETE